MSVLEWVALDIFLFLILIVPFLFDIKFKSGRYSISTSHIKEKYGLYLILIIIFCIFDKTSGDYFHYGEIVDGLTKVSYNNSGLEDVYFYIIKIVGGSYVLFRFIIWGSAVLFYFRIINYLKVNRMLSVYIFILMVLLNFSYARVSLALSVFFYGYVLLFDNSKGKKCTGMMFIICSLFLHKSMYVLIPISVASLFPFNKKMIFLSLCLLPFFVYLANYALEEVFFVLEQGSTEFSYLNQEREEQGIASKIHTFLLYVPILYFLLKNIFFVTSGQRSYFSIAVRRIIVFAFFVLYTSAVLYGLEVGGNAIYYRIRNMCIIPMSIVICYYLSNIKWNVCEQMSLIMLLCYNFYHLFYMYYLKNLGLGL